LFEACDRLPAQIAQPLNYTWAVALAILAWPILGQRPTRKGLMGMGVSYIGVVVLLSQGRLEGFRELDVFGILLVLASTLIWAIYWLLSVRSRAPALVVMTPGFVIGCICVTVVCGLTSGFPELNTANFALGAWVGLFEMGVTFLLWRTAFEPRIVAENEHEDGFIASPAIVSKPYPSGASSLMLRTRIHLYRVEKSASLVKAD